VMLYYVDLALIVFLLLLGIVSATKFKQYDTTHSFIFYTLVLGLLGEVLMRVCALVFENNIPVYNIINFLEFLLVFLFYYYFLGGTNNRNIFISIFLIFVLCYAVEIAREGLFRMFSYTFLYKNTILVFLSLYTFRFILKNPRREFISDYSVFWINTSILFYYSATLLVFSLRGQIIGLNLLSNVITYILFALLFLFYGLLSIGLWKAAKN
jgi:hypothetical protein